MKFRLFKILTFAALGFRLWGLGLSSQAVLKQTSAQQDAWLKAQGPYTAEIHTGHWNTLATKKCPNRCWISSRAMFQTAIG